MNGTPVTVCCVDIAPSPIGPAFVVVPGDGTSAVSRLHFYNDKFSCGDGNDKVGTQVIIGMDVTLGLGIQIRFARGYLADVPWHLVRTVTHRA